MFIFIIILLILLMYVLLQYNSFIKKKNAVEQSKSAIDVYLTQRFDLIPNLVACVKAYCDHEESIFEEITELRSKYYETRNLKDGAIVNNEFNDILAIGENYPNLKADTQFMNLQKNLQKTENQLQAARRLYNMDVTSYNNSIDMFPSSIIAKIFHFNKEDLFDADIDAESNINIKNT